MARRVSWLSILFAYSMVAQANLKATSPQILLVGDSWTSFMCTYQSFDEVLQNEGLDRATHPGCVVSTRIGMHADRWAGSLHDRATKKILKADCSIKAIVLSLGGNDLMNRLRKDMSESEQDVIFDEIRQHVTQTIATYREIRPDIKIVVSGYDYPRFTPNHKIKPYRQMFNEMGEPSPLEVNQALIRFSQNMTQINALENVSYIHHLGLMHYYYGEPQLGLPPGQTLSPSEISSNLNPGEFGGWMDLQTPFQAMLRIGNALIDAFHLNRRGYFYLAKHTHDHHLRDWLNKATGSP